MTKPKAKLAGLALIAALCAGFTLGLTAPAWAGLSEGKAAYKRGDYATALRELRPLAKQGSPKAQLFLGHMYRYGLGVPHDDAEAVKWYSKGAEREHDGAQYNLGLMYDKGLGVPRDYAKALFWYRMADAQGHGGAQYNLGLLHEKGLGVPQDYVRAYAWYDLAASSFPPGKDRDKAVEHRDIVAATMTPAQISEAQKLAREWRPEKTKTWRWRRSRERWLPSMTGPL